MMKRLLCCFLLLGACFLYSAPSLPAGPSGVFKTRYTTVYYPDEKDIDDFIWKLGGQRMELGANKGLASNRIDRIVERVEAILDMQPKDFKINIYLHRGLLESERIAFYDYKTRSIHISVDYATDGVTAHEIAHAVINYHFSTPLPDKMQEILTQYVDKYLWNDY